MEKFVIVWILLLLVVVAIYSYKRIKVKYDIDYFIAKFSAIPADKWTTQNFKLGDRYCALGFCGMTSFDKVTKEAKELGKLFGGISNVWMINDGDHHNGNNPKDRILNRLGELKMNSNQNK